MSDTASSIAQEVVSGLQADGIDARFVLLRQGSPTGTPGNLVPGSDAEYVATCQQVSASYAQRAGLSIEEGEIAVTAYQLSVTPAVGDRVRLFGETRPWSVTGWMVNLFGEGVVSYMIKAAR